jgi:dTDP-4-amino-4,6-dideoxygalactose transaminase
MRNAGIGVNLHYIPVHLQPFYQSLGFSKGDFPKSEAYYAEAISLPIYTKLTDSQQDTVIETLTNLLVEK